MTTPPGYIGSRARDDTLIRKALQGSVFRAPITQTLPVRTDIFDATTGGMKALPAVWTDLGWLDSAGFEFDETVKSSEITPFGAVAPVRVDITGDEITLAVTCLETTLETLGLFHGFDTATFATTPDAGGSLFIEKPPLPPTIYQRVLALGVDETGDGEFVIGRFFPRMAVTSIDKQTISDGDAPTSYGVTLTAYVDDAAGYAEALVAGGDGWLAKLDAMGFTAGS